jgi:hypothetical protein
MTIEEYVKFYGENYRRLITDSLSWLEEQKKVWELSSFNTEVFIKALIDGTKKKRKTGFY